MMISASAKDIVLVVCPPWTVATPHLGVGYLASCLREKELRVAALDFNIDFYNSVGQGFKWLWTLDNKHFWTVKSCFQEIIRDNHRIIEGFIEQILSFRPKLIGLSVTTSSRLFAIEIAKRVRRQDKKIKIVVGGLGCYTEWERSFFAPDTVDIFVIGEGEETLYEIINRVKSGITIDHIPGAILNHPKRCSRFIPRALIQDLDTIPFPTYKELDLSKYTERRLPLLTTRGCIRKCAFCHEHVYWGSRFRSRSPSQVFEEINYHVRNNHINDFIFNDFLLNGNLVLLESLCDLIIENELNISWFSNVIVREDMNYELLVKMKQSGCQALMFGIESGSDTVLKGMKKGFTIEQAECILRRSRKAGIRNSTHILVGFPGETEREFNETISFIKRNRDYIDSIPNVNDVHAVCNSDLVVNKDSYGIIMPTGKSYQWYTQAGLTANVRQERVEAMLSAISDLGFPKAQTNLYEAREQVLDVWDLKRLLGKRVGGLRFLISRFWAYLIKYGLRRALFAKVGDYLKFKYRVWRKIH